MAVVLPHAWYQVRRVYIENGRPIESEVLEGEVPMNPAQQDQLKGIIGDGLAKVSVGRDMSEMDYGSGGKVFVSVTLTVDQSYAGFNAAIPLAAQLADYYVEQHYVEMKQKCMALKLLKPTPTPVERPQY